MSLGEKYLSRFTETIEVKYMRAIKLGFTDMALILDVRNSEAQRSFARNELNREIDPSLLVCKAFVGDRVALAGVLVKEFRGNAASDLLTSERPPEGSFPIVVVTDEEEGDPRLDVYYYKKPVLDDE